MNAPDEGMSRRRPAKAIAAPTAPFHARMVISEGDVELLIAHGWGETAQDAGHSAQISARHMLAELRRKHGA